MRQRHEYFLVLAAFDAHRPSSPAEELCLKAPQASDTEILAELMLEAYRGTIDYEGRSGAGASSHLVQCAGC